VGRDEAKEDISKVSETHNTLIESRQLQSG
jgi:hypothetical protein